MTISDEAIDAFAFARAFGPDARAKLSQGLIRKTVEPGQDILHPGDRVNGVYLVRSGEIRVYYVDPSGREGTLYWIEPGQSCILALNSLFSDIPYPAWAAAGDSGVDVLTIPGAVFRDLFDTEPTAQKFLFEQLSTRVFSLLQVLETTMRLPQEERLILLLLGQADEAGIVRLSQEKLARHLGTIREVVSRLLRNLAAQGLIALAPRKIALIDRPRLQRMVPGDDPEQF